MKYSQKRLSILSNRSRSPLNKFFKQATSQSLGKHAFSSQFLYNLLLQEDSQIFFKPFKSVFSSTLLNKYEFMINDPINPINCENCFAFAIERYFSYIPSSSSSQQQQNRMISDIFKKIHSLELQQIQTPQFHINLQHLIKLFRKFQVSQIAEALNAILITKSIVFIPNDILLIEKKVSLYELILAHKLARERQAEQSLNRQIVIFQHRDHNHFLKEFLLMNQKKFNVDLCPNFFSLILSSRYFEQKEKIQIIETITTKYKQFKKQYPLQQKIDLIFHLFTSKCDTNALILINQLQINQIIQVCSQNPKKYNNLVVKMLESINMLDLKIEFASQLHSSFTNQGIRLLIESDIMFSISINPIKCLLLYLELLEKLKKQSSSLAPKIQDQKKKRKQAIRDIINQISNLNVKRQIFQQIDSKGRSMYELMSFQFDLLDTIQDIVVQRFQYGNGIHLKKYKQSSFMDCSIFKQVTKDTRIQTLSQKCNTSQGIHFFHFELFRTSAKAKYFIHLILYILGTVYFQYKNTILSKENLDVLRQVLALKLLNYPLTTIAVLVPDIKTSFIDLQNRFFYEFHTVSLFVVLLFINDLILQILRYKTIRYRIYLIYLTLYTIGYALVQYFEGKLYYNPNIKTGSNYQYLLQFDFYLVNSFDKDIYRIALSATVFLQWIILAELVKVIQFFGLLIAIIENMIYLFVPFAILEIVTLVAFAFTASIAFYEIPAYSTFSIALTNLFSATFGNFQFNQMTNPTIPVTTVFFVYFLVHNAVLMLNFLVALTLQDYSKLKQNSLQLYLSNLIRLQRHWEGSEKNGCMTYRNSIMIGLNFIFLPFSFLKIKAANFFFETIQYSVAMVIGIQIFICFDVFYFIYSWVLLIMQYRFFSKDMCKFIFSLLIYPALFPFLLVRNIFSFLIGLVKRPLKLNDVKNDFDDDVNKLRQITDKELFILINIVYSLIRKQVVNFEENHEGFNDKTKQNAFRKNPTIKKRDLTLRLRQSIFENQQVKFIDLILQLKQRDPSGSKTLVNPFDTFHKLKILINQNSEKEVIHLMQFYFLLKQVLITNNRQRTLYDNWQGNKINNFKGRNKVFTDQDLEYESNGFESMKINDQEDLSVDTSANQILFAQKGKIMQNKKTATIKINKNQGIKACAILMQASYQSVIPTKQMSCFLARGIKSEEIQQSGRKEKVRKIRGGKKAYWNFD